MRRLSERYETRVTSPRQGVIREVFRVDSPDDRLRPCLGLPKFEQQDARLFAHMVKLLWLAVHSLCVPHCCGAHARCADRRVIWDTGCEKVSEKVSARVSE